MMNRIREGEIKGGEEIGRRGPGREMRGWSGGLPGGGGGRWQFVRVGGAQPLTVAAARLGLLCSCAGAGVTKYSEGHTGQGVAEPCSTKDDGCTLCTDEGATHEDRTTAAGKSCLWT
ncbi:hypothetical protein ZEAMMB73_Zm00001d050238 [Zea mays]|uniref:Uncharacterized protein n=1 Tax=Zea mays TaxID=4577 RepID=A0A1D6Q0I3_MAIZE|nr:hypothetical protein ZEAMMB73_Zm00001d050238 [Zea mays]